MRLSNTNNFSASFNVATPYQMVVIHSSKPCSSQSKTVTLHR